MFLLPSKKQAYEKEIVRLKEKINKILEEEVGDPRRVVRKLLKGDISSYDWEGFTDKDVKKEYAQKAQELLNNPVFKNEINALYGDLIKEIAMESQNFGVVTSLRMTISGAKLIEERIEKIGVKAEPTKKEPFKEV